MRPSLTLAWLIWLAAAPMVQAGGWLRDAGGRMLSVSHEISHDQTWGGTWGYTTVYGEYELSPRLTLGLDAGRGDADGDWKALIFLRTGHAFDALPGRVAIELGLGAAGLPEGGAEGLIRPVLSWGYGTPTRLGAAWVNLDASAEHRVQTARTATKVDLTLGLSVTSRNALTLEVRTEDPAQGARTLRLAPSVQHRLGRGPWLRLGAIIGLENDDSLGLILGSRFEF
ncbi:MAG: hypothetical protein JXJ18_14365 [Rhodobacteraceae bacterium]|nr:hypothetical protein [Paracoccaceae bacterium]